jgi:hypothetical protein
VNLATSHKSSLLKLESSFMPPNPCRNLALQISTKLLSNGRPCNLGGGGKISKKRKEAIKLTKKRKRLCPCLSRNGKASSKRLGESCNATKHDICCHPTNRVEEDNTLCQRSNYICQITLTTYSYIMAIIRSIFT